MPSLDFASGIIGGYFDQIQRERARKEANSLQAAQFLLNTGRVRDFNDLLPFLGPLMESSPFGAIRKKGGQGGGQGKGQGKSDPASILSAFVNPMVRLHAQGQSQGQPVAPPAGPGAAPGLLPSPGAAPPPASPLLSDAEILERQMVERRMQGVVDIETDTAKQQAERAGRERFITSFNARFPETAIKGRDFQEYVATGRWPATYRPVNIPGTVKGSDLPPGSLDAVGQPIDPQKTYRQREIEPGSFEYTVTQPTGPAQRQYSQALQDKITEELPGHNFQMATDQEKAAALDRIARREAQKGELDTELKRALLDARLAAAKEKRNEDVEGYQGPVSGEPPDPAIANVPDRKLGGLTPGAIYEDALMFGTLGTSALAGRGLSNKGPTKLQKDAIQNTASARARAMGTSLVAIQTEYRGLRAGSQQAITRMVQIEAGRNIAEANLDLVQQLSTTVDRTSMPFINDKLQRMAKAWSPAIGLNAFETALYTAAREYARVTTAPASGAQLTVSATQRVDELIKAADTPEGLAAKIATMKKDMANVRAGYDKTVQDIYQNAPSVGAFLGIRPPATPVPQGGRDLGRGWVIAPPRR